jgi:hypothetical protein
MSGWLKERLVNMVVNRCLKAIGKSPVTLKFASASNDPEIANMAKSGTVYTLENQHITKHFYYSEPGGDRFISDKFESLADFILGIVDAKSQYIPLAAAFVLAPEKYPCPFPEITCYLERYQNSSEKDNWFFPANEVQKYLARLTYQKIDAILSEIFSQFVDYILFGAKPMKQAELASLLGQWHSSDGGNYEMRDYMQDVYTKSYDNTPAEMREKYRVTNIVNQMIVTLIEPRGVTLIDPHGIGLQDEERLLLSQDSSELIIYHQGRRRKYRRMSPSNDSDK